MDDYISKGDFRYFEDRLTKTLTTLTSKQTEYEKRISLLEVIIDKETLETVKVNILKFNALLTKHLEEHALKHDKFKLWIPLLWVTGSSLLTGLIVGAVVKLF